MAKTIKQIADELGVSKTAVRKKIENLGLSEKVQTNGNRILVTEAQESLIKSAFSQNESQTKNANQVSDFSQSFQLVSDLVSTLTEQLEEKDRQLREKDKQIERLQHELENAQKQTDQAQQLHAMTEQKLQLIEAASTEESSGKKHWWSRK